MVQIMVSEATGEEPDIAAFRETMAQMSECPEALFWLGAAAEETFVEVGEAIETS
jgi:hypothetical protein